MKQYPSDGFSRPTVEADLKPGVCLRMINPDGSSAPFSDCVIQKIDNDIVYLLRPLVWSNGESHVETFNSFTSRILQGYFHTVLTAEGTPYMMVGIDVTVTVEDIPSNNG